jgi:rubrerythrin
VQFHVFDVLRIAEEVERKAAKFYLCAAQGSPDPECRGIYYGLAAWRARRQQAWARLRRKYSERTGEFGTFDPDNYVLSNPQVMAGLTCFAASWESHGGPAGHDRPEQIVHDAIRRSRDTIVFYQGLKGFALGSESRTLIDRMIAEENRHIRLLSRSLERIQNQN